MILIKSHYNVAESTEVQEVAKIATMLITTYKTFTLQLLRKRKSPYILQFTSQDAREEAAAADRLTTVSVLLRMCLK